MGRQAPRPATALLPRGVKCAHGAARRLLLGVAQLSLGRAPRAAAAMVVTVATAVLDHDGSLWDCRHACCDCPNRAVATDAITQLDATFVPDLVRGLLGACQT